MGTMELNVDKFEDSGFQLHQMMKMEIVVPGDDEAKVTDILKSGGIVGYTLIRNVCGHGHHGFLEGNTIFNDMSALIMVIAVAPEKTIRDVAKGIKNTLEHDAGVMFLSPVHVARMDYFS
jgi:nitrogen regulatory protein PII